MTRRLPYYMVLIMGLSIVMVVEYAVLLGGCLR